MSATVDTDNSAFKGIVSTSVETYSSTNTFFSTIAGAALCLLGFASSFCFKDSISFVIAYVYFFSSFSSKTKAAA